MNFIFGRAGFGKTYVVREKIKNLLQVNNEKVLLIMPEQNSFETEKAMLNFLGPILATKVEVASFTRLVDLVNADSGNIKGNYLTPAAKNMLMSVAIENIEDKLKIYRNSENKIELVEMMISAMTEFKTCAIAYETLLDTGDKVADNTLKNKLYETAIILKSFDDLILDSYLDPLDDLTRLYNLLLEYNFFSDYTVFIDEFDGFNVQQLKIIEMILKQSKNCYITLCIDKEGFNELGPSLFFPIKNVAKRLENIAKQNEVEINEPVWLNKPYRFKNKGLQKIEKNVFRIKKEVLDKDVSDIALYEAGNSYDEADFVARTIKKLVVEEKYRYKDFVIIYRTEESYKGIIDTALQKYNIPFFMDIREDIDYKPLMCLILSALEIVSNNFSSESIFKYLKTGISGFNVDDISKLENYTLLWGITGKAWIEEFKFSPAGFENIEKQEEEKLLEELNQIREKIISPFVSLKEKTKNQTARNISKALYEFLMEINIKENLSQFVELLKESGEERAANEQGRLWDLLMDLLDQTVAVLNNKKIKLSRFVELFRLIINSSDIAFIPKGLDDVTAGEIDRIRTDNAKIVFVMGATTGDFPRTPASAGIFNESERQELLSLGLNMYDSLEGLAINERFLAYKALSFASEKLYISFPTSTISGAAKIPSGIIKDIKQILPKVKVLHEYSESLEDEVWSEQNAFELCARHWSDNSRFSETLKEYFSKQDNYIDKIKALSRASAEISLMFENNENANLFFGQDIKLSASQIEKYYMCKFQYFCKYGLLAKPRKKAKFDALEYGKIMHFILENTFKQNSPEYIVSLPKEKLKDLIDNILSDYIEITLKGIEDKPARFKLFFNRLVDTATNLIYHISNELNQSAFSFDAFEMEIGQDSEIAPLKLKLFDDSFVEVRGKIDRVDIMKVGKKSYIRVVDYKTGAKDFNLSDILWGLNMQMLIYLATIWKNGEKRYGQVFPAGVLYMPSKNSIINADRNEKDYKIEDQRLKKYRMNGLLLNDSQVIYGMEKDAKGLYIPVKMKDGKPQKIDSLVNLEQMGKITKYIEHLIINMATELKKGKIEPNPAILDDKITCEYCEYRAICKIEEEPIWREISQAKKEEIFEEIEKELGGDFNG